MECNKDDALLAKRKAEEMFSSHDFEGAKKFLNKAKRLFPNLDGVEQMLAVVDVHMTAEQKVAGNEMDWYGILQVDPSADENTIKKQYRKLALTLHPDKNKSVGAEAAFKLIGEALGILSDKGKRALHDLKRTSVKLQAMTKTSNGHYGVYPSYVRTSSVPVPQAPVDASTFWTACPSCKIQYQYPRMYENCQLRCPTCRVGFVARDTGVDGKSTHSWTQSYAHVGANIGTQWRCAQNAMGNGGPFNSGFVNGGVFQGAYTAGQVPIPAHGTAGYATASSAEFVHQMNKNPQADKARRDKDRLEKERQREEMRREKEAQKKAKEEEKRREAEEKQRQKEKLKGSEKSRKGSKRSKDREEEEEEEDENDVEEHEGLAFKAPPRRSNRARRNVSYKVDANDDDLDEFPAKKKSKVDKDPGKTDNGLCKENIEVLDSHKRVLAETGVEILRTIGVVPKSSSSGKSPSNGKVQDKPPAKEVESESDNDMEDDDDNDGDEDDTSSEASEEHLSVPDADFHDFDADRLEESVRKGQIWATYEEHDGMPRYYCQIISVQSVKPFRVRIKWLESCETTQTKKWLKAGFCLPFGEFSLSRSTARMDQICVFSHVIELKEGSLTIYPQEGQVWALYKDWMPGWSSLSKKQVRKKQHKYEMVVIVTGFSEQKGLDYISLQKSCGYVSIFHKMNGPVKHLPSEEIFRFSHMVPAHRLKGDEAPNLPKECWELDPAAIPPGN